MKIIVETSVIDHEMIRRLHKIETTTGADITVNIRAIVTYANDVQKCGLRHPITPNIMAKGVRSFSELDSFPTCKTCGRKHPDNQDIDCKETI